MTAPEELDRTALLVVDVQRGFDDESHWGPRNNPSCEENIALLIARWRAEHRPVVFARHDSAEPGSPLRAHSPGNRFKPVVTGEPDVLITKRVNSCFSFDRRAPDGTIVPADELARITATNLHGEFATVLATRDLLG